MDLGPTLGEILDLVIPRVSPKWEELGIKLFKKDQGAQLKIIRSDYPNNNKKCCLEMFKYWLQTDTCASWEQLLTALRSPGVNLPVVAEDLRNNLSGN